MLRISLCGWVREGERGLWRRKELGDGVTEINEGSFHIGRGNELSRACVDTGVGEYDPCPSPLCLIFCLFSIKIFLNPLVKCSRFRDEKGFGVYKHRYNILNESEPEINFFF